MGDFHYVAHNADGKRFTGSLSAESRDEALETLSGRFSIVTQLEERVEKASYLAFRGHVSGDDLLGFCQTLQAMLDGGLTLKKSLDTIYGDTQNSTLRSVVMDLSARIGGGDSLSASMKHHNDIFNPFFRNMIAAGEESGQLPEMLGRIAEYTEKTEALKDKVRSALVYPTIVIVFAGLLMAVILTFGIPYLRDLYDGLGIDLPASTQLLVSIGTVMSEHSLWLMLIAILLFYAVYRWLKTASGQRFVDTMKLRLPVSTDFFILLYTARFARSLAILYRSGVPLLNALELTAGSVGNVLVAETIGETRGALQSGSELSDALRLNPYFLDSAVGLVSAGEDSGKLDDMLSKVADFYERKVYSRLEALTATLEPIMMIGVGILIGGMIVTLGLPFMNLASAV